MTWGVIVGRIINLAHVTQVFEVPKELTGKRNDGVIVHLSGGSSFELQGEEAADFFVNFYRYIEKSGEIVRLDAKAEE